MSEPVTKDASDDSRNAAAAAISSGSAIRPSRCAGPRLALAASKSGNLRSRRVVATAPGDGPHAGLAMARQISQITFRSDDVFTDKFGREPVEPLAGRFEMWQRFQVERYLDYHGIKLARRFDANSYLLLTKAMDLHDLGRGRGSLATALRRISAPVLSMGITSDILYPSYQARDLVAGVQAVGGDARYAEIDSPHGHDAFLIDIDQVADALVPFLETPT